jgi:hypothetical protein
MPTEPGFYIELSVQPETKESVFVRSKQVPGLYLIGKCLLDMKPMVERAIKHLFKDNHGKDVNLIWLNDVESFPIRTDVPHRIAVFPVEKKAA